MRHHAFRKFRSPFLCCLVACFLLCTAGFTQTARRQTPNFRFINGQWFDGSKFRGQEFFSVDGRLTKRKPARIDEVIDLKNGFVIPPFADAHTHNFDGLFGLQQIINDYLNAGVFYAKVQTNTRSGAMQVATNVNRPDSVDVSYAHGGLTASYGHGVEVYEGLALYYRTGGFSADEVQKVRASKLRENDAYYIIDTAEDLERKWSQVEKGRPDFIKIYLLTSEEYNQRSQRTDTVGDRGLDPELVPLIVQKARAAGLRVSAHVDTVFDYRVALKAGVNELAHLPGYYILPTDDVKKYEIPEPDIQETARRGVWVIPAPVAYDDFDPQNKAYNPQIQQRTDAVRQRNLKLMKKHRVKIAFGSDRYGRTPVDDVVSLQKLGVFTNAEMLKIWCEDTPQTIFPARKIGKLQEGYEASFLVLDQNPLQSFANIKSIQLRFKQGGFIKTGK
jgi:imidazolonepropionase-like amidohydrolase